MVLVANEKSKARVLFVISFESRRDILYHQAIYAYHTIKYDIVIEYSPMVINASQPAQQ